MPDGGGTSWEDTMPEPVIDVDGALGSEFAPPASPPAGKPPLCQPTPPLVERAIRLSYAQMMLGAVFGASTGGMFLVGFAMRLGADNVLLGLMSTVPQVFVLFQFLAAYLVERGHSRKRMTVVFSFIVPLCWFLVAAIPLLDGTLSSPVRFGLLIGVMTLVTLAWQFAANARSSWIGELVPPQRRGRFFGYCGMFAGIVGAGFAIIEGQFLDMISSKGLLAFSALFFFGSLFGLAAAALNVPQPDCPLPAEENKPPFRALLRQTFHNKPFVTLALVHAVIGLGGIAGPFNAAYCLRDVGLSFFGLGLLNAVTTAATLLTSPYWGRMVDKFGCRPILILGLSIMAPCAAVWLAIPPKTPLLAYCLLPWTNFISGTGGAAVGVAIATMMYKTSNPQGRSVQFAAYSAFVSLLAAPMPLLGGWMVSALAQAGHPVDLRLTFYFWALFMFAASQISRLIHEPGSLRTRALLLSYLPRRLAGRLGLKAASVFSLASLDKFRMAEVSAGDPPPKPKADPAKDAQSP